MAARALDVETLVIGFCLLGVGVLWTLGNLGRLELLAALRDWWPLSFVVWGLAELYNTLAARQRPR